jgi:hypothetical protein
MRTFTQVSQRLTIGIYHVSVSVHFVFPYRYIYIYIYIIWAEHVTRMEEERTAYRILVGKQKERDDWEDQCVVGWTILKWILDR